MWRKLVYQSEPFSGETKCFFRDFIAPDGPWFEVALFRRNISYMCELKLFTKFSVRNFKNALSRSTAWLLAAIDSGLNQWQLCARMSDVRRILGCARKQTFI